MEEGRLRTEAFAAMSQLRLLQVDYAHLDGDFERFPPELRWLSWRGCPLEFIPTNFHMEKLIVLDLSYSSIKQVWNEWHQNQVVKTLKVLDLKRCENLIRTPDFTGLPCLERLNLEGCTGLKEVHKSVGNLKKLTYLNLNLCKSFVEVPSSIFKLDSLKTLFICGLLLFKKLPDLDGMKSLRELSLEEIGIEQLPDSIGCLKNLSFLSLAWCYFLKILPNSLGKLESLRELRLDETRVEELPDSIGALKKLEILSLRNCSSLTVLPDSIGDLESLSDLQLSESAVHELPSSIGCLLKLPRLSLAYCKFLGKILDTLWRIESLIQLNLERMDKIREIPEFHGSQSKLERLTICYCDSFSRLPDSIGDARNLTILHVRGSALKELPISVGNLESLRELILDGTPIENIPDSIGSLKKLEILSASTCKKLVQLPDSMGNLRLLMEIRMAETSIVELPKDFGMLRSLEVLDMSGCQEFKGLPENFASLSQLNVLKLAYCTKLQYLPELPSSLVELDVRNCISLERLADLSNLEKLKVLTLSNCEKLLEIEGIEKLKSLSELFMIGCNINRNILRKILVQGAFECLKTFSFPGSDIPDWFAHQEFPSVVCIPPDYEIDGLIVCGIFSRKDGYQDMYRRGGFIVSFPFNISRAGNFPCNNPIIRGIPKANEDQVCLFYYQPDDYSLDNCKNGDEIKALIFTEAGFVSSGIYGKKAAVHFAYRPAVRGLESKAMEDDKQLSHINQKLADFYTCDVAGSSHSLVVAPEPVETTMPSNKRKLSIRDRDTTPPRSR